MKPAPLGRRVVAAIFDLLLVCGVSYFVIEYLGEPSDDGTRILRGLPAALLMLGSIAYWIVPEWAFGATLGKLFFSLRVVGFDGKKATFGQILKRNVLRIADVQLFYLVGFLVARSNANRQRIGDLWAKTLVVKEGSQ